MKKLSEEMERGGDEKVGMAVRLVAVYFIYIFASGAYKCRLLLKDFNAM